MGTAWIQEDINTGAAPADTSGADMLVANCLSAAADGDTDAYYDLSVAFSTGSHGVCCDLVEAHKWFNLAAVGGHEDAQFCRSEISDEMTASEIAKHSAAPANGSP